MKYLFIIFISLVFVSCGNSPRMFQKVGSNTVFTAQIGDKDAGYKTNDTIWAYQSTVIDGYLYVTSDSCNRCHKYIIK